MIPLHLQLKNFLSYGEEPAEVNFVGMHTICLSGENGHGKSALLDAMTWALWGETRLGKQNHEQLIRLGADEMSVIFTFEVAGQQYRVRRQRSKRSSGQLWELQLADGDGGWRSQTGTGSADTGRAIVNLLRMSYDTFLNSAYLRQGRADEFVRQTANKRKEILCDILDLSRYDELEARARIKMRDAAECALDCDRRVNLANATLAERPALNERLAECLAEMATAATEQEALSTEWDKAREAHHALKAQQTRAAQIDADIRGAEGEIARGRTDEATEALQIEKLDALIREKAGILADFQALTDARKRLEALDVKVAERHRADRDKLTLTHEIETERRVLETQIETAKRDLLAIRQRVEQLDASAASLAALKPRIAALEASAERGKALQEKDIPEARDAFAELKHRRTAIDEKVKAAEQRIENLGNQTELCSVCGSPLPPDKIAVLQDECDAELRSLEREKQDINRSAVEVRALLDKLKTDLEAAERDRVAFERLDREAAAAKAALAELPELTAREGQIGKLIGDVNRQLQGNAYAADARAKLAEIQIAIVALAGVETELEGTRSQLRRLESAEKRYHSLAHAEETVEAARKRVDALKARATQLATQRDSLVTERAALADVEQQIKVIETQAEMLRKQKQAVSERILASQKERGHVEEALKRCEQALAERAEYEKLQTAARRDEEIYKQLAGAFGKQGVQALIIENAIPELQTDANSILERLTDGDLSVQIDTQKLGKSKGAGVIETLEIIVTDHLGTRPLELYSGGESFRISFALRIALSNLLARRAGARLQTLIIDEGFGTQDAKGREKLVDAINAIKDDFERIIVITHIDELKEAFPSRIDVYKTPLGSQLTVTEGGMIG